MGINMDMKNKPDYKFINLEGLDENIQSDIKAILKSEIASNVLKLPWNNGEKDYNSNSMIPDVTEVPLQWQHYGDNVAAFEMPDRTTSLITSPISRAVPYAPSFMPVPYQEWQLSNAYPSNANAEPNAFQQFVSYGAPIYQTQASEVLTTAPSYREPDRRRSNNRSRKNESYNTNTVNSTEMPTSYVMQQGQFNQMQAMCHPNMSYVAFQMQPQPHPAAGRTILMPSHQFPRSSMHLNSHPQYPLQNYPQAHQQSSPTLKQQQQQQQQQQHSRQQSQQQFLPPGNTKRNQSIQKCEKKPKDQQTFSQQLSNENEADLPRETTMAVINGDVNGLVVMQNQESEFKQMDMLEKVKEKIEEPECVKEIKVSKAIEVLNAEEDRVPKKVKEDARQIEQKNINDRFTELKVNEKENLEIENIEGNNEPVDSTVNVIISSTSPTVPTCISFANAVKKGNPEQTFTTNGRSTVDNEMTRKKTEHEYQQESCKRPGYDNSSQKMTDGSLTGRKKSNNNVQNTMNDPNIYRMGEFLLSYQMDKQTVSLLPRGLTNRSNYCYINSILQALLACPPFYNLLKAVPRSRHPSKNSPTPLIDNMVKFVNEYAPLSPGARLPRKDLRAQRRGEDVAVEIQGGSTFEPSYVYTMLKNTSCPGVFSIEGRQEDAEEFLSCLLNGISDEMLELMKQVSDSPNTTVIEDPNTNYSSGEEWKVMGPKNKGSITRCTEFGRTPLSDIFRGQLRSRISRQGEQSTDNVQPFFTLQLDIEKAESVEAALEILVGKDQVEGMTCSKTKQQIQAWKQVTLEELPVILILHLKWFDYKLDGCSKICKSVSYAIDLNVDGKFLTTNVSKKLTAKQKQYKLFAVTYHDGKEATKGHYVTDAFHVSFGAWVRYDDSSVKGISEHDVLNPAPPRVPYLLYYRRCDTIGNNQPNNHRPR